FGMDIDAEWRSDMKWDRLKDHIIPLKDRIVLDVGCANGYHCFRMLEQEPSLVFGIDPSLKYVMQFNFLNKYASIDNIAVLPLGIDDIPMKCECFDTVFSMGLLYHRRSPFDHLIQLHSFLKEGGELILETIVCDGKKGDLIMPEDRYAQMPNLWFIPSVETLKMWLSKCRFNDIKVVDVSKTTANEQRATDWSGKCSLEDFLDPKDRTKTIEGYPAPKRAIFTCRK
ncbi:MAG: tRNA 5-methoxyuridine(34)/uridine 5-oxyacetic acid(34) synthase CmoB, partial [Candidatus Omnitrophica bacterium]|nr:tRNA 5-methoxyuridine(34)/uridine 5-oxyacetic acid(34) synthase CmoB [Candidatus Omnitrophota bacterium]